MVKASTLILRKYRETQKSRYETLKDQGICVQCGQAKARENRIHCQDCADKLKKSIIKNKEKRRKSGKCLLCGGNKSYRDMKPDGSYYVNCFKCRNFKNHYVKNREGK
ncbi:hypothetical protein SDC9_55739 [bioreactor metagenome]|uniref:Uncharacterized protein n=1 Tax=bioreactor metagenome TaxID=1076179 RepID=A0A644WZY5_9ZZZZ